jgi:hypothetical protein
MPLRCQRSAKYSISTIDSDSDFWHSPQSGRSFGGSMEPEKPDWQQLCAQAAGEEDPQKLMELIAAISRDLEEKEKRLRQQYQPLRPTPSNS